MTDPKLTELLERAGDRATVGPPPIDAMLTGAARTRRRRRLTASLAGATAVVAVVAGLALVTAPGDGPDDRRPPADSTGPDPVPDGMHLVGLGSAAVAVPDGWGTNETHCGVPQRDTVVINVGAIPTCAIGRPGRVESIELVEGQPRFDFRANESSVIGGVEAQRQRTTCPEGNSKGMGACSGTVYFPTLDVWFRAESSTNAEEVDRILERITIVPDRVGVPAYQMIALDAQGRSGEQYVDLLREMGLEAVVETKSMPGLTPGYVLDASPAPGTMLAPGDTVTVTVTAEPRGPAEELSVGVNTEEDGEYASDAQIRRGATINLSVGDRIWAYAEGKRTATLAGDLQGTSLAVDDWEAGPNYPHSWVAVAPGRTTIELRIVADGSPVVLGEVRVEVN